MDFRQYYLDYDHDHYKDKLARIGRQNIYMYMIMIEFKFWNKDCMLKMCINELIFKIGSAFLH
jgi:hypothetical protein